MFGNIEAFIKKFELEHLEGRRVKLGLDVGSFDVNGTVRKIISPMNCETIIGIDMREGPGVDHVINGHDICEHFPDESFDLVTCCETFEHDDKFWLTLENMKRVLKKGGWLLITAPSINYPLHDFPSDFYRFTVHAFESWFEGFSDVHIEYYENAMQEFERKDNSIFAYGRKK